MKITYLILILFAAVACKSVSQNEAINKREVKIEMKTKNKKSRMLGTNLYAKIPKEYTYNYKTGHYENDSQQSINFLERQNESYFEMKEAFYSFSESATYGNTGLTSKEIQLGANEGYLIENINQQTKKNEITLLLGDEKYIGIVKAYAHYKDTLSIKKQKEVLLSIHYDLKNQFDPLESFPVTFDRSITKLDFLKQAIGNIIFTQEGESLKEAYEKCYLSFEKIGADLVSGSTSSTKEMTKFAKLMVGIKTKKYQFTSPEFTEVKINQFDVLLFDSFFTSEDKKGIYYQAMFSYNDNPLAILTGVSFVDREEWRDKFIRTAESVKFTIDPKLLK